MAPEGVQRLDAHQFGAGLIRWAVEWLGCLEERGVECIPGKERDGEGLLGSLEELVPEVPEFCRTVFSVCEMMVQVT